MAGRNNKWNQGFKKRLFISLCLLLSLPFATQILTSSFSFTIGNGLKGNYEIFQNPKLTLKNWFSGDYAKDKESYLNQNFPFRNYLVRGYNQVGFSVFKDISTKGTVLGQDDYLYERGYIDAWLGQDFVGRDSILRNLQELEMVTDTLNKMGIQLIFLFAPGKAYYYPEHLPAKFQNEKREPSNYETILKNIGKVAPSVRVLDFHTWFQEMKDTSTHTLFPRTGIHWSKYGELIAMDSLLRYINSFETTKKVPVLEIDGLTTTTTPWDTDDDIEQAMNLLFPLKKLPMTYGKPNFIQDSTFHQPKVLTIGDSFYWGMFNYGLSRKGFDNGEFWYYFNQVYPQSFEKELSPKDMDIAKEIKKNDVILIVSTDENLKDFTFGFIQSLYKIYYGG